MIVIAIIGILAAALFPSLTSYLKRSRDAARASNLKDMTNAIGAFYSDRERYPDAGTGCMHAWVLNVTYMEAGVPRDPQLTKSNGCAYVGFYTYASGSTTASSPQFALAAIFENDNGGNFYNGTGLVSTLLGTGTTWVFAPAVRTAFDLGNVAGGVFKWNGSGYLLYK